jgi:hypothetical protein
VVDQATRPPAHDDDVDVVVIVNDTSPRRPGPLEPAARGATRQEIAVIVAHEVFPS